MARRRYISTQISIDRQVNELAMKYGDFAALLYTWMIPHAEDNCLITADPYEILMKVCPCRRDKDEEDVKAAIDAMISLNLIELVEVNGTKMLQFPPSSFYKYQTYIPERKRTSSKNADNHRTTPQNAEKHRYPSPTPSPIPIKREIERTLMEINNKSFEFGMNGISPEFLQDAEMRLHDGTDAELIIKALSIAATKANGNSPAKCKYAISVLQGWAGEGIKTIEDWEAKYVPKPTSRDKPKKSRAEQEEEKFQRAKEEAMRMLREEGIISDDEQGSGEDNYPT